MSGGLGRGGVGRGGVGFGLTFAVGTVSATSRARSLLGATSSSLSAQCESSCHAGSLAHSLRCAGWGIVLFLLLPNSPATFKGFTHEEKLLMIARMRKNQTGVENRRIKWDQVVETYTDYKTYMFCFLGFIANIPNGGISNVSGGVEIGLTLSVLHAGDPGPRLCAYSVDFVESRSHTQNTLQTALLGIPQGVLVVIWIGAGAIVNQYLPKNSRTIVCGLFMLPTIAGALGFLLAPTNAYVGRLICL